jgi:hypothetical protein
MVMNRLRSAPSSSGFVAAAVAAAAFASCDWNDPDEIQNSSNFAVVRAQFFASRENRVPVPGVRLVVESDAESDRPYNGPDVITLSGEDGVAIAKVFPGLTVQEQGGGGGGGGGDGGQTTTGPRNPLEVPAPLFFGDARVVVIYQGDIVPFIGGGLTIGSGRLYDLGSVFLLEDLGIIAD